MYLVYSESRIKEVESLDSLKNKLSYKSILAKFKII
jgi:hypothetical protein